MEDFENLPKMAGWHETKLPREQRAMEPTNKLRFVERSVPMHPFYKTTDAQGNLVQAAQTYRVLQQLWEEKRWAHDDWIVISKEWRDIPLEQENT
jgi:hypothetical protein